jgi:hypothetical protein
MLAAWLSCGCCLLAQAPIAQAPTEEAALKEILYPFYAQQAADYEIFRDPEQNDRLKIRKQPVLTWTNSENYMGAVFIWELAGRPEMIGCIGSHQNKPDASNFFHELHSLSLAPLQPVKFGSGGDVWQVTKPGLALVPIDGASSPADSERARLTQMRNVAREYRGWMQDGQDVTELRLLTQPIVRYKSPEQGVSDGAIFAFVWKGTDPEILLVVEARRPKDAQDPDAGQWQAGLVRFNFRDLWAERNGKEVWRVGVTARSENYITAITGEHTHAEIRQTKP